MGLNEKLAETLSWLRARFESAGDDAQPQVALVLGSGMNGVVQQIEGVVSIPFADIPHFNPAGAPMHTGALIVGTLQGVRVVCMQGRLHLYEGFTPEEVVFPLCVMNALGARSVIFTNASGGIRADLQPGDVLAITDHINFTGEVPFSLHSFPRDVGRMLDVEGGKVSAGAVADERMLVQEFHPYADMVAVYTPALIAQAHAAAERCAVVLKEGVYIGTHGPQLETPAEIRAFGAWGADVVGMSTVLEAIAARTLGMDVLCLSLVVNHAAGVTDTPATGADVAAVVRQSAGRITAIICELFSRF